MRQGALIKSVNEAGLGDLEFEASCPSQELVSESL